MPVATVRKSMLVLHRAEDMFRLVDEVEHYPDFLPWYGKTEIISRSDSELQARLHIDYMGLSQSFATRNHNTPPHEIRMNLLEGPFKTLEGHWRFLPVGDDACQVEFVLRYEAVGLLARLISPVFGVICAKLVEAFVKEADKRHAGRN
ncbi:type II toxin-antitoxin system RatA family toxin [Conchiformibius kuhniae]|uniref:Type II toxin-antitoxin system RatA family toxin n=1 Tax=Conchiformibius kuhniae TaxID=211502 RepID=A0ABD8B8C8_9NEIS|nr:type II toxin-antitoxin system RatA family toxin [Conchiformibius kuhniae]